MSNLQLTKDSDALICLMYKKYCQDRKEGKSKIDAKRFGSVENIHKCLTPKWACEDVDETLRELSRAGMIKCRFGDGIILDSQFTDDGIIYMESRFQTNVKKIIEHIAKIAPLIPFV